MFQIFNSLFVASINLNEYSCMGQIHQNGNLPWFMCINLQQKWCQNDPTNDKQHFSSGAFFIAAMGPLSTPKVVQKGPILRSLASQKGAMEPLLAPPKTQRFHCEGPGRLKWCPEAHLGGFGVPRCPQKLHLYATDAQNWSLARPAEPTSQVARDQ